MLEEGSALTAPRGSLTYKFLIQPEALACVAKETLLQFLRPHEAWCAENGVALDGFEVDPPMLERLHDLLDSASVPKTESLAQALFDLGNTAGVWGSENEIGRAIAARQSGVIDPANVVEAAFSAYVVHHDQFSCVADRANGRQVQRLVEFVPSVPMPLQGHHDADVRGRLEHDAGRFFGARNRTRFCECKIVENTNEIQFEIVRGNVPRRHRRVIDEQRVDAIDFVPARSDFLIFDKRTRMLAVHAQQAAEHDYYRRLIGRLYFASEDHFRVEEVYSGQPLAIRGEDALSTQGFPEIQSVELRELRTLRDGREILVKGRDVRDDLTWLFSDASGLEGSDVQFVKLAIYVRLRRRPILVAIKPPNHCTLDRRVGEDLVRAFLIARGFLRLPAIDPAAEQLEMKLEAA